MSTEMSKNRFCFRVSCDLSVTMVRYQGNGAHSDSSEEEEEEEEVGGEEIDSDSQVLNKLPGYA